MSTVYNLIKAILEDDNIKQLQNNYAKYVEYVHEGRWKSANYLTYICDEVQKFIEVDTDNAYDILILQMPPQHGKSMTITEVLPSWYMGKYPENKIILASYNDEEAEKFTKRNKDKIRQFGKQIFNIEISKSTDRASQFELSNNLGRMISRGLMSGITSNPANLIIIDDPIKNRQQADSETSRKSIHEEWQDSIKTRLAAKAKVIIIQTRWHEDDLAGYVMQTETNVRQINIPCEAEADDPIGRNIGDSLGDQIGKDNKWLQQTKEPLLKTPSGTRTWNSLYQGRASSQEGNIIKRSYVKYYDVLPQLAVKVLSVDASFTDSKTSDQCSLQVWGKLGANIYLVDNVTKRMDFLTTLKEIKLLLKKHPDISSKYIENKANGLAIINVLNQQIGGFIPIKADVSTGGKRARLEAISYLWESGNIHIPLSNKAIWSSSFVDEICSFPTAKYDDQVDAMSQAVNKLRNYNADIYQSEQQFNNETHYDPDHKQYNSEDTTWTINVSDDYFS